ncbi:hypothetical protein LCGC14_1779370 [marine sediment metagenome]|uniref:Uncharacterized protein n=1 Tax=marine sediment metagenome TaxID=412755 RepID=A0A0F9GVY9_9ZZZZ
MNEELELTDWLGRTLNKEQCIKEGFAEPCIECKGKGNKYFTFSGYTQKYLCVTCSGLGILIYY